MAERGERLWTPVSIRALRNVSLSAKRNMFLRNGTQASLVVTKSFNLELHYEQWRARQRVGLFAYL